MPRPRPTYAVLVLASLLALVVGLAVGPRETAAAASPPATPTARVTLGGVPASAPLNRRVPVAGTVTNATTHEPLAATRVQLQVRGTHGWSTPPGATAVTDVRGVFTLGAPTFYYGRHVFRAVISGSHPDAPRAASRTRVVTVPVPYHPAGRAGAGRTDRTRFDPCTPIPYRINLTGAPRNARTLVEGALGRARAATGLTFAYAGPYAGVPFSRQRGGGLPSEGIGIAWSTPGRVPGLTGAAIGLGGGGWSVGRRRTSSGIVVDRTFGFRRGWKGSNSIGGLLLHELGHALGLEHVSDRRQQMYPRDVGAPNGNYNRGDLAALARVGLDAGCL